MGFLAKVGKKLKKSIKKGAKKTFSLSTLKKGLSIAGANKVPLIGKIMAANDRRRKRKGINPEENNIDEVSSTNQGINTTTQSQANPQDDIAKEMKEERTQQATQDARNNNQEQHARAIEQAANAENLGIQKSILDTLENINSGIQQLLITGQQPAPQSGDQQSESGGGGLLSSMGDLLGGGRRRGRGGRTRLGRGILGGIGRARGLVGRLAAPVLMAGGGLISSLTNNSTTNAITNVAGNVAETATRSGVGTIANSGAAAAARTGAGAATRMGGKALFKSAMTKIPFLGALAGIGYGIGKLAKGDFTGAALEVASGAASIFPGVGTAASVGIDAAILARDIKKSRESEVPDLNTVESTIQNELIEKSLDTTNAIDTSKTSNVNVENTLEKTIDDSNMIKTNIENSLKTNEYLTKDIKDKLIYNKNLTTNITDKNIVNKYDGSDSLTINSGDLIRPYDVNSINNSTLSTNDINSSMLNLSNLNSEGNLSTKDNSITTNTNLANQFTVALQKQSQQQSQAPIIINQMSAQESVRQIETKPGTSGVTVPLITATVDQSIRSFNLNIMSRGIPSYG